MINSHDDHYKSEAIEPFDLKIALLDQLIARGLPMDSALAASESLKYIKRAGRKEGEDWRKDIEKAANYLYRAVKHQWPWEVEK